LPYYAESSIEAPYFLRSAIGLEGWEQIVPDLHRKAVISGIFMDGRGLLEAHEMPTNLVINIRGGGKTVPDIFHSHGGICIVSDRMRSLLEELDPGCHQFFPIQVFNLKREAVMGEHFILNVHQHHKSVVDELSVLNVSGTEKRTKYHWLDEQITMSKDLLPKFNLWRERHFARPYFVSDLLIEKIKERKMSFLEMHRAKTI
jgi:hypothetical protein